MKNKIKYGVIVFIEPVLVSIYLFVTAISFKTFLLNNSWYHNLAIWIQIPMIIFATKLARQNKFNKWINALLNFVAAIFQATALTVCAAIGRMGTRYEFESFWEYAKTFADAFVPAAVAIVIVTIVFFKKVKPQQDQAKKTE